MAKEHIHESRSLLNVLVGLLSPRLSDIIDGLSHSNNADSTQIVVFVTLGSLSYGYCASIIASTLGQLAFISFFDLDPAINPNANALLGATNGIFQTGGFFGALVIGYCADRFSRRGAIAIASVFLVVGGALQSASVNIAMFLVMRFITGFGVGLVVGAVPLYQSEVSPPHSRGFLVGLHG